jgi:N-acetylglucosamine-6-phosphate deacetylase
VACGPAALRGVLDQVRRARAVRAPRAARVLPAHLESNFINPDYNGAQPKTCLRSPKVTDGTGVAVSAGGAGGEEFTAQDILQEIERARPDVGIVTLASELDGGVDLVRWLVARGHRVSLGHSGATYEEALTAIAAGACQATHLFNRMPPLGHRAPGLAGAVLQADEVVAEIICDGVHVHPSLVHMAIAAKRPPRVMAISDATAATGLAIGGRAALGGQPITAGEFTALLPDGTIAGSICAMDRTFQMLVGVVGLSLVDAAVLCATTAARELGLVGHGVLAPEAVADLVVLDANLTVVQTYVAGQLVYTRNTAVAAPV